MLGLAREYNAIISAIDAGDRGLFADRLRQMDKRVLPGLQKITWEASKRDIDFFTREAKKACAEAAEQVAAFKVPSPRRPAPLPPRLVPLPAPLPLPSSPASTTTIASTTTSASFSASGSPAHPHPALPAQPPQ